MSTGTIQNKGVTLSKFSEMYALGLTLVNGSGAALAAGTEVRISGDETVNTRTATQYPIGVVVQGGEDAEDVTVKTNFLTDLKAIAIGGTLAAGSFVVPNGNFDANGRPEYIAAVSTNQAYAMVLKGGTASSEIRLGIMRSPVLIP